MPTTTLVRNFKVSAPFVSNSFEITSANAGSQVETTITAPLNTAAVLAAQIDASPDGAIGWQMFSSLIGPHGGTGKDGVSPAIYIWAVGVTPDMVGQFLRVNFTAVSGGQWTLNVTETV